MSEKWILKMVVMAQLGIIALKVLKLIQWSWWWVWLPSELLLAVLIISIVLIMGACATIDDGELLDVES